MRVRGGGGVRTLTARELAAESEGRRLQQEQRMRAERIGDRRQFISELDAEIAHLEAQLATARRQRDAARADLVAMGATGELT